jgi:multisubunit Na+/H+ antiporter MnhG subunit
MNGQDTLYCPRCGEPGEAGRAYCPHCGVPRDRSRSARAAGVAFLLNEVGVSPLAEIITTQQRARMATHYEQELRELVQPVQTARTRRQALAEAPQAAAPAVAAAPPSRRPPAAPARRPTDWSWLVEQQANLFLFAGAFLTVIAALIYVGYSGQAVDGSLKMALLIAYTMAFLVAGTVCLRVPRVAIAGQVFFAVGALLVPLNFAAARSILSGEDLNARTLWLAGSITTAAFYTAVAWLAVGRQYAFGAGVAFASAMLAAVMRLDVAPEWAPICFLALAAAMSIVSMKGPATLRPRVESIWTVQAHVIAAGAVAYALILAPFARARGDFSLDVSTLWYLPVTFAALTLYTALPMLARKQQLAGIAGIAAFSGGFITVVYAIDVAGEYYAVAFAALAVVLGALAFPAKRAGNAERLPERFGATLRDAAVGATALAAFTAFVIFQSSSGTAPSYQIETRWFAAISSALVLAFYVIDAFGHRERAGVWGRAIASTALCASIVYGLHVSAEYYAFAFILPAIALGAAASWAPQRAVSRLAAEWRDDMIIFARTVAPTGAAIAALAVLRSSLGTTHSYQLETRWFAAIASALVLAFYLIDAFGQRARPAVWGCAMAFTALCASVVYGLNVSAEYYTFALIAPSIALIAATCWAPQRAVRRLAAEWREDIIIFARAMTASGIAIALFAATSGESAASTYHPQFRAFLPVAFAAAAAFCVIDASRVRRLETSAALLLALTGASVSTAYAVDAQAAYYGAAFAVAGAVFALGGRAWSPRWLDADVRDMLAAVAFTIAWLPFEAAYEDAPRVGASVHLAAATFYAMAAIFQRSDVTLLRFLDVPQAARIRATVGWLYAAGLAATLGYLHLLNSLPGDETIDEALRLGYPMMAASLTFVLLGAASRWWRPEFRMHLYVIALAAALVSLTTPASAETLSVLLTVYVAASLTIALYEDEPLLAAPAAAFGFGAIAAWRVHFDAPYAVLPITLGAVAILAAAASVLLQARSRWSAAARVCAATYAVVAPATGFLVLASQSRHGYVGDTRFFETALYEWATLTLGLAGALALLDAVISHRRWIIVPASAVLAVALLLQIGRFDPENAQAYTAVIGAYFLLLGLLGLWKFQLIPELAEAAPVVEALGAAMIMVPSMIQSLHAGGGRYEWIVLAEAAAFFTGAIVLRRRGMLSAAIVALVLVASRVLFDAVNALPNWVVVMIAGMALLGVGMGILLGRERWVRWQEALLGWWAHAGAHS